MYKYIWSENHKNIGFGFILLDFTTLLVVITIEKIMQLANLQVVLCMFITSNFCFIYVQKIAVNADFQSIEIKNGITQQ